jgi:glycosyltransferase involved in cell wall biosynthesis
MKSKKCQPNKVVAIVANTSWYVVNFRLSLIKRLKDAGYKVVVFSNSDPISQDVLSGINVDFECISFDNHGAGAYRDIRVVCEIVRAIKKYSVGFLLTYTPKANINVGFAAIITGVCFLPNISGFGVIVNKNLIFKSFVFALYRCVLWKSCFVFVQNLDDLKFISNRGLVAKSRCIHVPGSGVDINRFRPAELEERSYGEDVFLFASRLLWDKGIGVFVDAARRLRIMFPKVIFKVVGQFEENSPYSVSYADIERWTHEGLIHYDGIKSDIRCELRECDCVVLPSYYGEGVPRILLEAAATMRPSITTDSVGCREAVVHGVTGFICRPRDVDDLVRVIVEFINLPHKSRMDMAKAARFRVESEFNEEIVLSCYESTLNGICYDRQA